MSVLTVYLNGQAHHIAPQTSLADFLQTVLPEENTTPIATAVNEIFIPKTTRSQCILQHHDQIMTFSPITGG